MGPNYVPNLLNPLTTFYKYYNRFLLIHCVRCNGHVSDKIVVTYGGIY